MDSQRAVGPRASSPGIEPGPQPSQGWMPSITPRGQISGKADDWCCTSMIRSLRPAPHSFVPRRPQQAVQGVEPCGAVLEAACSPRSTPLSIVHADSGRGGSRTHKDGLRRLNCLANRFRHQSICFSVATSDAYGGRTRTSALTGQCADAATPKHRKENSQDGRIRTGVLLLPKQAGITATPHPDFRSPYGNRTHPCRLRT
jgi:hypothetical protein